MPRQKGGQTTKRPQGILCVFARPLRMYGRSFCHGKTVCVLVNRGYARQNRRSFQRNGGSFVSTRGNCYARCSIFQWFPRRLQQQNKGAEARLLWCKLLLHLQKQDTSLCLSFLMYVYSFSACYAELLLAHAFIVQACVARHTRPVLNFFFLILPQLLTQSPLFLPFRRR